MSTGNPRAYHLTVHALEDPGRLDGGARFNIAIEHVLSGHLPFGRAQAAADARFKKGAGSDSIEHSVARWLEIDLNPIVSAARSRASVGEVLAAYNLYQSHAQLAIVTNVHLRGDRPAERDAERRLRGVDSDCEGSRQANFAILERLARWSTMVARGHAPRSIRMASEVALLLGVERSAAAQACEIFELEGPLDPKAMAKRLGCGVRTLQRQLRQEGTSAEKLRMAVRLLRATERLGSSSSLTEIAVEEGFSDLAHMSRAFRQSCGMPPSSVRKILRGELQA